MLERFWTGLFNEVFPGSTLGVELLNIARGNGAVPRMVLACSEKPDACRRIQICGVDESLSALLEMRKRHPVLQGDAGNAQHLPFADGAFDIFTSQFGMEFACTAVFAEAARLVIPGGLIAAVLHLKDGGIYRGCEANLHAIEHFRHSGFLDRFEKLFRAVTAAAKKTGTGTGCFDSIKNLPLPSIQRKMCSDAGAGVLPAVPRMGSTPILVTCIDACMPPTRMTCLTGLK